MGRFEIATGKIPKEDPKKKKPEKRIVINYEDGDKVRKVVVNFENEVERPVRNRPEAHPRTRVGGGSSRQHDTNESFEDLVKQALDEEERLGRR